MDNIVMIKQEIDFLIKNTQLTEPNYTLCLSELDYLNLCTFKKRSKIKVYKGFQVFYTDKINVGTIYLMPLNIEEIKARLFID